MESLNIDGMDGSNSAYSDKGISIRSLDYGVSGAGLQELIENLHTNLVVNIEDLIDDVEEINGILDTAWQGVSRDRFDELFKQQREAVKADIEAEYADIVARLQEIASSYIDQDKNMIS